MQSVPRELFVPSGCWDKAYDDRAHPISCEQTISQPYIVAYMTQLLELDEYDRVLELGTGSGYQAAILSRIANHVTTIERHEELARTARTLLERLRYTNITVVDGNGYNGFPCDRPFKKIIITAAAPHCPPALLDQLTNNGILVGPFGNEQSQRICKYVKQDDSLDKTELIRCRFVPLVDS